MRVARSRPRLVTPVLTWSGTKTLRTAPSNGPTTSPRQGISSTLVRRVWERISSRSFPLAQALSWEPRKAGWTKRNSTTVSLLMAILHNMDITHKFVPPSWSTRCKSFVLTLFDLPQIIWPTTSRVAIAAANSGNGDRRVYVGRYSPQGNFVGQTAYSCIKED